MNNLVTYPSYWSMVQKSKARVSGLGSAAQSTDVPLETEKWHVKNRSYVVILRAQANSWTAALKYPPLCDKYPNRHSVLTVARGTTTPSVIPPGMGGYVYGTSKILLQKTESNEKVACETLHDASRAGTGKRNGRFILQVAGCCAPFSFLVGRGNKLHMKYVLSVETRSGRQRGNG